MDVAMEQMEQNESVMEQGEDVLEQSENAVDSGLSGKAEWETFPPCTRQDCHAWKDGRCVALTDSWFGNRDCPFYKDFETNRREQEKCMKHLIETGRTDLIKKYRKVLAHFGLFDVADDFADSVADELEKYSDDVLRELLGDEQSDGGIADASGEHITPGIPTTPATTGLPGMADDGGDWDD